MQIQPLDATQVWHISCQRTCIAIRNILTDSHTPFPLLTLPRVVYRRHLSSLPTRILHCKLRGRLKDKLKSEHSPLMMAMVAQHHRNRLQSLLSPTRRWRRRMAQRAARQPSLQALPRFCQLHHQHAPLRRLQPLSSKQKRRITMRRQSILHSQKGKLLLCLTCIHVL